MTSRWNIVLVVIALALLAWYYSLNQQDNTDLAARIQNSDSPDYIANQMETTLYSLDGRKQYVATADEVEYFQTQGDTLFKAPIVYLFETSRNSDKLVRSWRLSADQAKISKDKILYLNDNVSIQSLLPESKIHSLQTSSAVVNLTTQDITSDTMVSVVGQSFTTTGKSLSGNLRQQIATLKEQVQTHYEIQQNENKNN
ncbi:LPS export ABC transporter periplasmic protein LptC [Testudinibacter sp. TR-2022]|uniref:LPS export ABC transporter periplasmic protein LptC n=1 Tax=Testudinibacter sp. TR-2022 TaxID=2585029 RepID=UPI001118BED5|nr:LPS export ABC transporter periplasmic protein LptC [Testudinibacter sp. TR-2022]TNH04005.1 LPS export ABC transporter periplasmic protein LptC [Pasteurellaceae bacterium Phil31]TNH08807.1 LPS export ABC transporter periplasmic protein LptC [Testudinibacter sp. TR-2022]TNH11409.1 LPS export ABC transporter periplasmic protein LptC [Testudinibacter sp. TR-2022]TNH11483.1 LPS export ABC transporter periplasmic protein LptC [Testudinibacter sp. TR-2022]TNH17412.1 LPS export ABC transporter per